MQMWLKADWFTRKRMPKGDPRYSEGTLYLSHSSKQHFKHQLFTFSQKHQKQSEKNTFVPLKFILMNPHQRVWNQQRSFSSRWFLFHVAPPALFLVLHRSNPPTRITHRLSSRLLCKLEGPRGRRDSFKCFWWPDLQPVKLSQPPGASARSWGDAAQKVRNQVAARGRQLLWGCQMDRWCRAGCQEEAVVGVDAIHHGVCGSSAWWRLRTAVLFAVAFMICIHSLLPPCFLLH